MVQGPGAAQRVAAPRRRSDLRNPLSAGFPAVSPQGRLDAAGGEPFEQRPPFAVVEGGEFPSVIALDRHVRLGLVESAAAASVSLDAAEPGEDGDVAGDWGDGGDGADQPAAFEESGPQGSMGAGDGGAAAVVGADEGGVVGVVGEGLADVSRRFLRRG